jgi:hypothetical protein
MRFDKFCQSCMFNKKHELFNKGTEKDWTESNDDCKIRYLDGAFTQPEITTAK